PVGQGVDLARLADVPVLAEVARQVAARGAERQPGRAGQEVVQRLLLDGIDAEAAGAPPGGEDDRVVLAGAHEAQPALTLVQAAGAGTDIALHPPIVQPLPVPRPNRGAAVVHGSESRPPAAGVKEAPAAGFRARPTALTTGAPPGSSPAPWRTQRPSLASERSSAAPDSAPRTPASSSARSARRSCGSSSATRGCHVASARSPAGSAP